MNKVRSSSGTENQRDGSTLGFLSTIVFGPLVYLAGLTLLASLNGLSLLPLELIGFMAWQAPFGALVWLQAIYLLFTELPPLRQLKLGKSRITVERASISVSIGAALASLAFSMDYFSAYRSFGASAQTLLAPWLQHQVASGLVQALALLFFAAVVVAQALVVNKQNRES